MKLRRTSFLRIKKILDPVIKILYYPIPKKSELKKATTINEIFGSHEYKLRIIELQDGIFRKIQIKKLFRQVRKEIDSNLLITIEAKEKKSYLKEVLNLYAEIDEKIVEDENGYLSTALMEFIRTTQQPELYFDELEILLNKLKNKIREEIGYLTEKMSKLQENSQNIVASQRLTKLNSEIKRQKTRIYPKKSFELNPRLYADDPKNIDSIIAEKLKDFKEALLNGSYIKPIDLRDFMRIFKNQEVKNPIQWDSDPKELYYLIRTLYNQELIVRFKNYWCVTCKCFIIYRKNKSPCTPPYLQRCKLLPRGEKRKKLDSVIDTLK